MRSKILCFGTIAVMMLAIPAFAHHSFAMFDATKTVTLEGKVKEFHWTNPHSWIFVMVPDAEGHPVEWAVELGSPSGLARIEAETIATEILEAVATRITPAALMERVA